MVLTGSTEEPGVGVGGDFGMFVDPGRCTLFGRWVGQLSGARVHDVASCTPRRDAPLAELGRLQRPDVGESTDDTVPRLHQ